MTLNTSFLGRGRRENGGKGSENKNNKWHIQNRQGDVKNSIGNGEAKELVCTTHGHERRRVEGTGHRGLKGGKKTGQL